MPEQPNIYLNIPEQAIRSPFRTRIRCLCEMESRTLVHVWKHGFCYVSIHWNKNAFPESSLAYFVSIIINAINSTLLTLHFFLVARYHHLSTNSSFLFLKCTRNLVSLSHQFGFHFRFKLGFHRIQNYQTTWMSLSCSYYTNWKENCRQTHWNWNLTVQKVFDAYQMFAENECIFWYILFIFFSTNGVIGTYKPIFKLDFHSSSIKCQTMQPSTKSRNDILWFVNRRDK